MSIASIIAFIVLILVAALLWGRRRQFGLLALAAALMVLFPVALIPELLLWLIWFLLVIAAFIVPYASMLRVARVFVIVVTVLCILGVILSVTGVDMPLSVSWTGQSVHFHSPIKSIEFQQPVTMDAPTSTTTPLSAGS